MPEHPHVLFAAWQNPKSRIIYPVGRLTERDESPKHEYVYIEGVRKAMDDDFVPFVEFPVVGKTYLGDKLFPLFANRVMSQSRPDYSKYVERLGLTPDADPITVLARSEGRRTTDLLELFAKPECDVNSGIFIHHFLVRGIRHMPHAESSVEELNPGDKLFWMFDKQNPCDKRAVALRTEGYCLVGFMPHYLVEDFHELNTQEAQLSVTIEKVNRPPAPVHHRLLCQLKIVPSNGYQPFTGTQFDPIVSVVE